ncbi:polyprenyl synthetase superfamily protein [Cystoisospora suis]|uniref:Polyprenyl synthetase superfamily protein n=1 Tax=Cystoisospora suis TaxID=483139 RepID=A0A2C6KIL3_9APIC|nr:polyprenyl synthetase superfamily protein [Cystoisospora suis]
MTHPPIVVPATLLWYAPHSSRHLSLGRSSVCSACCPSLQRHRKGRRSRFSLSSTSPSPPLRSSFSVFSSQRFASSSPAAESSPFQLCSSSRGPPVSPYSCLFSLSRRRQPRSSFPTMRSPTLPHRPCSENTLSLLKKKKKCVAFSQPALSRISISCYHSHDQPNNDFFPSFHPIRTPDICRCLRFPSLCSSRSFSSSPLPEAATNQCSSLHQQPSQNAQEDLTLHQGTSAPLSHENNPRPAQEERLPSSSSFSASVASSLSFFSSKFRAGSLLATEAGRGQSKRNGGDIFSSAWRALERRQIESRLPKYIFNDDLSEEVFLGMEVTKSPLSQATRESLLAQRQSIDARLEAFAGGVDPFALVRDDIDSLEFSLLSAVKTVYPDVSPVSKYLLTVPGKRFRPVLLLLLRRALLGFKEIPSSQLSQETSHSFLSKKLNGGTRRGNCEQRTPAAYLSQYSAAGDAVFEEPDVEGGGIELCIVQVAELIHTASMMHDDVIDGADVRRGQTTAHRHFGNKKAILGGDFLLSRGGGIVATLGSPEVMLRIANVVESLVKGEIIQALSDVKDLEGALRTYLTKTYHKTAALIAESCASLAILAKLPSRWVQWSLEFGTCVGMAFQIYDDELDFTASTASLGKPALNDLRSGIVTAPLLLAALEAQGKQFCGASELRAIIERRAGKQGDVEKALASVFAGSAMPRAQLLTRLYVRRALELLDELAAATAEKAAAENALVELSHRVNNSASFTTQEIPLMCRGLAALLQATLSRRAG